MNPWYFVERSKKLLAISLFFLVMASFPLGLGIIHSGLVGTREEFMAPYGQLYIFIAMVGIPISDQLSISQVFYLAWFVQLLVVGWASKDFLRALKDESRGGGREYGGGMEGEGDMRAVELCGLLAALLLLSQALQLLVQSLGIPSGSLIKRPPLPQYASLTFAPLAEEFGFRLILLGLPVALASSTLGWKMALAALWKPITLVKEIRGGFGMPSLIFLIFLSAAAFGIAHIVPGGGWRMGKLADATLAGLGIGWAYAKLGFPASIFIHMGFNYFLSTYNFLRDVGFFGSFLYSLIHILIIALGSLYLFGMVASLRRATIFKLADGRNDV